MRESLLALPAHDGSARYVPEPAPTLGSTTSVLLCAPAAAGVRRLHVRTTPDGEPRYASGVVDSTVDGPAGTETWWRAEIDVRNPVTAYRFLLETDRGPQWLTAAGLAGHDVADNTDFRVLAYDSPPAWALDAVVYQIFPDRFARSGEADRHPVPEWAIPCGWDTPVIGRGPETPYQFYGGDLCGIIERLDHIASLGANTIYLTPIFPARSNHRYDAAAFDHVDPLLGGDAALARLGAAARERGMRVLGDLTTNHCGETHPWFRAALSAPGAPEREMFYFPGVGVGGGADDYESWLGVRSLPKLNWGSGELRRRFVDGPSAIAQRWLRPPYGLDGWRVDVANMTGRRAAQSDTWDVARLLRRGVAAARPDGLLVAEHAHDATADLDRDGWHGTMNYAGFTRPLWTWLRSDGLDLPDFLGVPGGVPHRGGREVATAIRTFAALTSWRTYTHGWSLLGSHDTARIRTVAGDPDRVEVAVGLLLTMPGVPMIFAGDEIGQQGVNGEDSRRPMPWHRRADWDEATWTRYRALVALRHASSALRHGGLRWAHIDDDALCFLRETADERVLVFARRVSGAPLRVGGVGARAAENVYGGATVLCGEDGSVQLPADGPAIQIWRLR